MAVHGNDDKPDTQSTVDTQSHSASAPDREPLGLIGASRGSDTERNERLLEAVRNWIDKKGLKERLHAIPMPAARYQLRTSAVIVATDKRTNTGRSVFYAVLYTETQELKNFTRTKQIPTPGFQGQSQPFDFPITMFDVIDAASTDASGKRTSRQNIARQCVKDQFPEADKIYFATQFPVLLEAQVDGANADPSTMDEMMFDVSDALDSKIQTVAGQYQRYAKEHVAGWKNKIITLKTETNPHPACDINGIPIRSDLSFVMTASDPNAGQDNILRTPPAQIARADAYIQPMYFQQVRKDNPMNLMMQGVNPALIQNYMQTYFLPEVHITNLQPQGSSNSLEDILLGLVSVTSISDNVMPVLTAAFQPRKTTGAVNLRNIGALGVDAPHLMSGPQKSGEAPQPFVLDTNTPEYQNNPQELMSLLDKLFAPTPLYLLHIPEASELSYRTHAFLEATMAGDVGLAAKREIIQAVDNLTDGAFSSEYWKDEKRPVAALRGYRMPLGYCDIDGVTSDIRRFDTLALRNIEGAMSNDTTIEWTDALYNDTLPNLAREAKLLRVLRHHAPNMRITGRAHVLLLERDFLEAVREAILNSGAVNIQLQSNLQSASDDRVRGMPGAERFAAQFTSRFSSQGGGYSGGAGAPGAPVYGGGFRWG